MFVPVQSCVNRFSSRFVSHPAEVSRGGLRRYRWDHLTESSPAEAVIGRDFRAFWNETAITILSPCSTVIWFPFNILVVSKTLRAFLVSTRFPNPCSALIGDGDVTHARREPKARSPCCWTTRLRLTPPGGIRVTCLPVGSGALITRGSSPPSMVG